jgi:hypothetical protein
MHGLSKIECVHEDNRLCVLFEGLEQVHHKVHLALGLALVVELMHILKFEILDLHDDLAGVLHDVRYGLGDCVVIGGGKEHILHLLL